MTAHAALASLALMYFIKTFWTVSLQAVYRIRSGRFARAEDAAHWKGEHNDEPRAVHAQLALRNDAENIPQFLCLAAACLWLGGAPNAILTSGGAFFVFRTLHTWAYVHPRQPLRNRVYQLGLVTTVGVAIYLVWLLGKG